MPLIADFHAQLDADERIVIPPDALSSVRRAAGGRLRITISTAAGDPESLAARGIEQDTVDLVAVVQKFERDLAALVLSAEGSAGDSPLGTRLMSVARCETGGAA